MKRPLKIPVTLSQGYYVVRTLHGVYAFDTSDIKRLNTPFSFDADKYKASVTLFNGKYDEVYPLLYKTKKYDAVPTHILVKSSNKIERQHLSTPLSASEIEDAIEELRPIF